MKQHHGFTLVELLVVIAIVGILLGIGIVAFHSVQDTARRRADEATVRVLNSATTMLELSVKVYRWTQCLQSRLVVQKSWRI